MIGYVNMVKIYSLDEFLGRCMKFWVVGARVYKNLGLMVGVDNFCFLWMEFVERIMGF